MSALLLQLLADMLLDRSNSAVMTRYVSSRDNLRILMNLLRVSITFPLTRCHFYLFFLSSCLFQCQSSVGAVTSICFLFSGLSYASQYTLSVVTSLGLDMHKWVENAVLG